MAAAASTAIAPDDGRLRHFAAIVEAAGLYSLAFQHLALCRRRAWLHLNRIDYAHLDWRMALGTVAHALHRTRDRSVEGLMGLAPDRIDWSRRRVHEAKGSAGAKDAVSLQTAFNALMLMAATGEVWEAVTDILPERRHRPVPIDGALLERMLAMAVDIAALAREPSPPTAGRKRICPACSYRFLCGFG
jgi:CRISPR-associated exonuclease Cas4